MTHSISLKSASASLLNAAGTIDRRLRREGHGRTVILTYHRVLPADTALKENVQAGMYVEPGTFAMQLRYLKERFDIVPLADMAESDSREANKKPRCVLTFDDGWRDFLIHAFPVVRDAGAPATLFLPTEYIGSERRFWTDRLAYLFRERKERPGHNGQPGDRRATLAARIDRMASRGHAGLESAIGLLKDLREEEIEGILHGLASRWGIPQGPPYGPSFLSWEDARELKRSGLIAFGSHSVMHRILTTLTDAEAEEELRRSLERIVGEGLAEASSVTFCYPNGGFDGRIARLVREAGYRLAVTTERGWNGPETDPYALRRISVHQDMTSSGPMLGCRILGIF
jgi:peptidoglycan/xylan/chitin deacetylase (PgdA/CDA1 family)